ncbi:MAG: PilW family protein [Cycloclasticus sp.]|nr:PilW family protein [Cycloclasticus sp.]
MSSQKTTPHKTNPQKGFTLVELMIALVIGLILTAGILQLFVSNKQTYRVTENVSRLQENGRFAMHFLTNDIRMADFWGCRGQEITIDNNLNADANFDAFSTSLGGTNDSGINGSDTITLKGAFPNAFDTTSISKSPASFQLADSTKLTGTSLILLSDCSDGDLIQMTNAAGTFTPSVAGGGVLGNVTTILRSDYDGTDAKVYQLNFVTYSIQQGFNGQNALFKSTNGDTPQELVEGIENMQILYGEDTDADGAANYYKPAGSAGLNMDNVVAVRISLVAVTLENNVTQQANTYNIFGGATITPTDNRIRRVFTSTIVIRNRLS